MTAKNPKDIKMKSSCVVSENNILPYIASLSEYMHNAGTKVKPFPKVKISKDTSYSKDPFGKTAYYDPELKEVVLFTEGRHIKDVLRSFAHEMVHHSDNLSAKGLNEGYAQEDKHLRHLEERAYLIGNMRFRDWEDSIKDKK